MRRLRASILAADAGWAAQWGGWDPAAPEHHPCEWAHVSCNAQFQVTAM